MSDVSVSDSIRELLGRLPNRQISVEQAVDASMARLSDSEKKVVGPILTDFAKCLPRCYGVGRKKAYWRKLSQYIFDEGELVSLYLGQFPTCITYSQRDDIVRYLNGLGFDQNKIQRGMSRFTLRSSARKSVLRLW